MVIIYFSVVIIRFSVVKYHFSNETYTLRYFQFDDTQSFEVWIADSKSKEQKLNFEFNAKKEEQTK